MIDGDWKECSTCGDDGSGCSECEVRGGFIAVAGFLVPCGYDEWLHDYAGGGDDL